MTNVSKEFKPVLRKRYLKLDKAMQDLYNEVLAHCDQLRTQAETRLESTDEHTVIDDSEYYDALGFFNEVFELRTTIQSFHDTWIGAGE